LPFLGGTPAPKATLPARQERCSKGTPRRPHFCAAHPSPPLPSTPRCPVGYNG
jgi:hypothetical protein